MSRYPNTPPHGNGGQIPTALIAGDAWARGMAAGCIAHRLAECQLIGNVAERV